jgi:hypothetical protein
LAVRERSATTKVGKAIETTLSAEDQRKLAASRLIRRLKDAPNRDIDGKISWTRDDLYDRRACSINPSESF